jgi:hypothetical protein
MIDIAPDVEPATDQKKKKTMIFLLLLQPTITRQVLVSAAGL